MTPKRGGDPKAGLGTQKGLGSTQEFWAPREFGLLKGTSGPMGRVDCKNGFEPHKQELPPKRTGSQKGRGPYKRGLGPRGI